MRRVLIFFMLLLFSINCFAQNNCDFKIDKERILSLKNLDYFLAKFQSENFFTVNNIKEIPKEVKLELDCLTGDFSIANPNEEYQDSCIIDKEVPRRQLLLFAKNDNFLILKYAKGGDGSTTHYLFIEYKARKIVNMWSGMSMGISTKNTLNETIDYINKYRGTDELSNDYLSL